MFRFYHFHDAKIAIISEQPKHLGNNFAFLFKKFHYQSHTPGAAGAELDRHERDKTHRHETLFFHFHWHRNGTEACRNLPNETDRRIEIRAYLTGTDCPESAECEPHESMTGTAEQTCFSDPIFMTMELHGKAAFRSGIFYGVGCGRKMLPPSNLDIYTSYISKSAEGAPSTQSWKEGGISSWKECGRRRGRSVFPVLFP